MGFFIKDLFITETAKFQWHDKLTNPPTVPETSPIIKIAAMTPQVVRVQAGAGGNGGSAGLPADDTTLQHIPTPVTPIVVPDGRLVEADLQLVRDNLTVALRAVESQLETMQATPEQLQHVAEVVRG